MKKTVSIDGIDFLQNMNIVVNKVITYEGENMWHLILTLLALFPGEFCMRMYLARLIKMKSSKLYIGTSITLSIVNWICANKIFPTKGLEINLCCVVLLILVTWSFAPRGMKGYSILLSTLFYTAQLAASSLTITGMRYCGLEDTELINPDAKIFPVVCLTASVLCIVFFYLIFCVAQKIFVGSQISSKIKIESWIIVPLTIQLLFLIGSFLYYYLKKAEVQVSIVLIAAVVIAIGVEFSYGIIFRKYILSEEKSWKLQQVESQLQTQTVYFEQMQKNILHINQIRHDLNNQLQAAYYLLEKGNTGEVRKQLDALQLSVTNKVGPRYCPNLMVDAVLSEKAEFCRKHKIPLEISVLIPSEIPVDNVHLCSIFSNLLDNSIHEMQKIPESKVPIRLSCDLQQGFLVIRCENPCINQIKMKNSDPLREHGLGLAILQQLSEEYHGSMERKIQNGKFLVTIMLNLIQEANV